MNVMNFVIFYFIFNFGISTNSWNLPIVLHRKLNMTYNNNYIL